MKNQPQRLIFFLVVWLTMFSCIQGYGQNMWKKTVGAPDFKHLWLPGSNATQRAYEAQLWGTQSHLDLSWSLVFAQSMSGKPYAVPSNIYYAQSGMMCKMEWQVEKATHIPLRLRLGSLADCNRLEGKP